MRNVVARLPHLRNVRGVLAGAGQRDPERRLDEQHPKYVASTTLDSAEWNNSTVIEGDVAEAVEELKRQEGANILVNGSGELVRSLMRDHLLDELRLYVHPVVVGTGRRLFDGDSALVALTLVDSHTFDNGVVGLTYRPTGAADTDPAVRDAQLASSAS